MVEERFDAIHEEALLKIRGLLTPRQQEMWDRLRQWKAARPLTNGGPLKNVSSPYPWVPDEPSSIIDVEAVMEHAFEMAEHLTVSRELNHRDGQDFVRLAGFLRPNSDAVYYTQAAARNRFRTNELYVLGPAYFNLEPFYLGGRWLDHTIGRIACIEHLLRHAFSGDWDDRPETIPLVSFLRMHQLLPSLYGGHDVNYERLCEEDDQRPLLQDELTLMFIAQISLPMRMVWDGGYGFQFSRYAHECETASDVEFADPIFETLLQRPDRLRSEFAAAFQIRLNAINEQGNYFWELGREAHGELLSQDKPAEDQSG